MIPDLASYVEEHVDEHFEATNSVEEQGNDIAGVEDEVLPELTVEEICLPSI